MWSYELKELYMPLGFSILIYKIRQFLFLAPVVGLRITFY